MLCLVGAKHRQAPVLLHLPATVNGGWGTARSPSAPSPCQARPPASGHLTFLQLGRSLQPLPHSSEPLLHHHSRVPWEEHRAGQNGTSSCLGPHLAVPLDGVSTEVFSHRTHRNCRSFSRRSLPLLDMMSSGTLGVTRVNLGWGKLGPWGQR